MLYLYTSIYELFEAYENQSNCSFDVLYEGKNSFHVQSLYQKFSQLLWKVWNIKKIDLEKNEESTGLAGFYPIHPRTYIRAKENTLILAQKLKEAQEAASEKQKEEDGQNEEQVDEKKVGGSWILSRW